jgi:hypothetical protein
VTYVKHDPDNERVKITGYGAAAVELESLNMEEDLKAEGVQVHVDAAAAVEEDLKVEGVQVHVDAAADVEADTVEVVSAAAVEEDLKVEGVQVHVDAAADVEADTVEVVSAAAVENQETDIVHALQNTNQVEYAL